MNDIERGQRSTRQRRLILDTVRHHLDHPCVETIYREVHEADERISMATVYRNLNLLAQNGEILHIKLSGADRYDSTLKPHSHIVCLSCGAVEDVAAVSEGDDDRLAEEATGYRVYGHQTVYEGLCPACLSQNRREKE